LFIFIYANTGTHKTLHMLFYYFILLLMLLTLVILSARFLILRGKNIPVQLFNEAIKNENNGSFEAALVTYESALTEVKKIRFHSNLKNRIIDKIQVLHTIIEYKNNFRFIR
jgi:hypothetical protein